MFKSPVLSKQNDETFYDVQLTDPIKMGVQLNYDAATGLVPSLEYQSAFQSVQDRVLSELAMQKQIFKTPPTIQSLKSITPAWGFIAKEHGSMLSPYTIVLLDEANNAGTCTVDLELTGIRVSRSTIRPVFKAIVVNTAPVIDFDWGSCEDSEGVDIEEISDIPEDASSECMKLHDPVLQRQKMLAERDRIRGLLQAAALARNQAREEAERFFEMYDVSDSESVFSEWMTDAASDSESESEMFTQ